MLALKLLSFLNHHQNCYLLLMAKKFTYAKCIRKPNFGTKIVKKKKITMTVTQVYSIQDLWYKENDVSPLRDQGIVVPFQNHYVHFSKVIGPQIGKDLFTLGNFLRIIFF